MKESEQSKISTPKKAPTEEEIQRRKLERKKENAKILSVPIEQRIDTYTIRPGFYYVVIEKDLRKPKILKRPFRDSLFAYKFIMKYYKETPTIVMKGQDLINLGILKSNALHTPNARGSIRYSFPKGLDPQRRKTMRTMFRRNLRRLILKYLQHGK
jgi:hypothetical protein